MKNLLTVAIVGIRLGCFAQTPINSNIIPKTFDKIVYYGATPFGFLIDSGANVYWDFSGFALGNDSAVYEYINVPEPYKAQFQNSGFSIKVTVYGQIAYHMYSFENNKLNYWGFDMAIQPLHSYYSDADILITFPINYGNSNSDNYQVKNFVSSDSNTEQGFNQNKAVGYGRLKLPGNAIFDSVLLQYSIRNATNNKGFKTKEEVYEWFHPRFKDAISVLIQNYNWNGSQWNPYMPTFSFQKQPQLAPELVSVNEVQRPKLELFPNPGRNRIFINSEENIERISITNILGTSVCEKVEINGPSAELDISSLPNQLYVISVQSTTGHTTSQLFVKVAD